MSPPIGTWALAVMAFCPFAAAWPRTCPASCMMTVTETITSMPSCSVLFAASTTSASSATETSLVNPTSTSTQEQRKHHHHHTSASWTMNSTATGVASSNMVSISSATVSSSLGQGSSAEQTSGSISTFYTTSQAAVPTTSGAALSTGTPAPPPNDCQPDNCLRDFIRHPEVTGFCATYTTELNTATTGLPTLVSQCQNNPTRISSACSCVLTGTATSTPTPPANDCQHDNCLRYFIRHPEATGFCATYTTELNTATTGLPNLVSQCHFDPTRISSACSCIATGTSSPTSALGGQTTTNNAGTFTATSSFGAAQTATTSASDTCPVVISTLTSTQTFVSTFTLDDASTSGAWSSTSSAASGYAITTTSSTEAAASTVSIMGHRRRHGHQHGQ